MNKIDICLSSDNNYIPYMSTLICSILKNSDNDEYHVFHIVTDGINDDNKNKLESLKKIKDFCIKYYIPNTKKYKVWFDKLTDKAHFSPAMFFRLDIPNLIDDIDKIIYLDCDIIVNKSLKYLYDIDIENYYLIASIRNTKHQNYYSDKEKIGLGKDDNYFNSGVLVINIKKWKQSNIDNIINDFVQKQDFLLYGDEHIFNVVFKDKTKFISENYNYLCNKYEDEKINIDDIFIFHFCTDQKPWNSYCPNLTYTNKWWEYFYMTPFFQEDIGKYIEILIDQKINNIINNDIYNINNSIYHHTNQINNIIDDIQKLKNETNNVSKLIYYISWWIPIKKWRENFRNKFKN
ncbi:glycosyltransferase family 8 protein [Brachyspira pilosicoli]